MNVSLELLFLSNRSLVPSFPRLLVNLSLVNSKLKNLKTQTSQQLEFISLLFQELNRPGQGILEISVVPRLQ